MSATAEPRAWALKKFFVFVMKTLEMSPMLIVGWFCICVLVQGTPLVIQQHEKAIESTISSIGNLFKSKSSESLSDHERLNRIASDLGQLPDEECDAFIKLMMKERGIR